MKTNKTSLTQQIGFTQEEIALLLRINRTTWSMYEIQRRSLKTDELLRLTQLMTILSQPEQTLSIESQPQETEKLWQEELEKTQLEKLKLERKIKHFRNKHEQANKILLHVQCLIQSNQFSAQAYLLDSITHRGRNQLKNYNLKSLTKMELELEVLTHKISLLEVQRSKK
ncbi:hypothetical protein [Flavobacterium sp.]|uniref:hypothetical protein n=1 Tax=Flavobacterium sp. TaxID=239 RepID=UPI003D1479AA